MCVCVCVYVYIHVSLLHITSLQFCKFHKQSCKCTFLYNDTHWM